MHDRRKSVTSSLPDDGTGKKEVWRVESFELKPVALSSHGVFFSGDCYVVLYTYVKNTKERHIIYFWLVSVKPAFCTIIVSLPQVHSSAVMILFLMI